ncbi:sensor histidine kinase [Streptomyces sp. AV19]|uniref:sensor histidine kinase n=1 Tax=Streptomyces sp. AV19 TaxID=2793068 RepID=UPI0018FE89BD|nr:sensor histidine kinase [Streptomyces sp. AV19]MBH1933561.1 sensor histidine kinase [Streptomyces sp. AV19]MDG4532216.1 sensor histidine kinase [Streptomyces sp. AV19]
MTSLAVSGLDRPQRWLRSHPVVADVLLAAGVLATTMISTVLGRGAGKSPPGHGYVVLAVLAGAALVARRRAPRLVLAVTSALSVAGAATATADGVPRTQIAASAVVALYTVASRTERSTAWRIAAVTVTALTATVMLIGPPPWYAQENVGLFAWMGMAAAAGDAVRSRRAYITAIEERALRAERSREEEALRRVAEERMRIARELHDVVAHHIALVNVQAGVASHVMDSRPDRAKEALAHVREASRSALGELRATVGLLRQYGDPEAPTQPAPGLAVLDGLVDGFVRAGLPVDVALSGPAGPLPAAVDLTAYRVLQEALTNVRKHAGPGARAELTIRRAHDALVLTVLDDGTGTAGDSPPGGHGLIGMRERVAALGGTIETGPRADGSPGYRVRARLPLPTLTP